MLPAGSMQTPELEEPADLTPYVLKFSEHPVAHGAYGDIWKAVWESPSGKRMVRIYHIPSYRW